MGWANVRRTVTIEVDRDPHEGIFLGLGRRILRSVQGQGLHVYHGADGSPETSYGGAYAGAVQPDIVGAAGAVSTTSVTRDLSGADIATGITAANSGASRAFADRLRRRGI